MHAIPSLRALVLTLAVLAAARIAAQEKAEWKRVEPGQELSFPRDHGSHPDSRTEWWYLNGHLSTEDGETLGFQFTVFRQGIDPSEPREGESSLRARNVFAAHLAIAQPARGSLVVAERLCREGPLASAATTDLDIRVEDWSLKLEAGLLVLEAGDAPAGVRLALSLEPQKPLVLQGERGYSQKGPEPGNASMYTSWTSLVGRGSFTLGSRSGRVQAEAWFDHEFGTSQLPAGTAGWDWFSLQLDDGRDLMLYRLRDERGEPSPFSSGTLVEKEGRANPLAGSDFVIDALSSWTSPRTHASYPASWRVRVPTYGLDLRLTPLLQDCELDTTRSTGVIYWEGPIRIEGSAAGKAYAELTGYAGSIAGRF